MKYIVFRIERVDKIIIFCDLQLHSDVANNYRGYEILGAGFIRPYVTKLGNVLYTCYGESVSVGMPSRGQIDTNLANYALHGSHHSIIE